MAVTVEQLLAAAGSAIEQGDFNTVVDLTDQALEIEPGNEQLAELRSTADRIRTAASTLEPFGRRMLVTFLFCDIAGSTEGVEALELEEQRDLWNVYYEAASEVVEHYDGHIVKYLGDGLLIAFGYPVAHEDDPRRAVHAALGIRDALRAMNTDGSRSLLVPRIGIHTGEAIADTSTRRDVFGLAIHKTDRVQRTAAPGSIVVSEATSRLISGYFDIEPLGPIELRSFAEPEHLFRVDASRGIDDRLEAAALLSPFVGRNAELSRLSQLWGPVDSAGAGAVAVIVGDAGIGKSRLARIVRDRAVFDGANAIHASCSPYYALSGFHAFGRLLEDRCGVREVDDPAVRFKALEVEMQAVGLGESGVELLAPLLGVPATIAETGEHLYTPPPLDRDLMQSRTMETLFAWIGAVGASAPTVIVVEDLQWADASSELVLQRLMEEGPPAGILMIATTRPTPSWTASLERITATQSMSHVEVIELGRFDGATIEQMIDAMDAAPIDAERRARIVELSEGVPLFVEELMRSERDLPESVEQLLQAQVQRAGSDLAHAQVAAVIGTRVDLPLLAAVNAVFAEEAGAQPLTNSQLVAALDRLVDVRLLERRRSGAEPNYRFRHALIRDAVYGPISPADKQRLHHVVAEQLVRAATGGVPNAAIVALHFERAGDQLQALEWYGNAARSAFASGGANESIDAINKALGIIEAWPDSEDKALIELQLLMLRGANHQSLTGYGSPDAYADFTAAQTLSDALRPRYESAGLLMALNAYRTIRGERDQAQAVLDRLDGVLAGSGDNADKFRGDVLFNQALHSFAMGEIATAREQWEASIEEFERREHRIWEGQTPPNDPHAGAYAQLIPVYWMQGEAERALAAYEQALSLCDTLEFPHGPFMRAYTHSYAGWTYQLAGDPIRAIREFQQTYGIGTEHGFVMWQGFAGLGLTTAQAYLEPARENIEALEGVNGMLASAESWFYQPCYRSHAAWLRAEIGELDEALAGLDASLRLAEDKREQHFDPMARIMRARVLMRLDRDADAATDLRIAHDMAESQGSHAFRLIAALAMMSELDDAVRPDDAPSMLSAAVDSIPDADAHPDLYPAVAVARGLL